MIRLDAGTGTSIEIRCTGTPRTVNESLSIRRNHSNLSPAGAYPDGGALPFLLDGEAVNRRLSDRESQLFGEPGSVKIDDFVRPIDDLRAVAEEVTNSILQAEVRI